MSDDQEEQEWRKRLHTHYRNALVVIILVFAAYFAALIAVIRLALNTRM
jgi:hypothetical protein